MFGIGESKENPALKDFSFTWETVKHVGAKAIKWAAYGALACGLVMAPFAVFGGGPLGWVSSFFSANASGAATALGWIGGALSWGAVGGAIFGGIKGVADAGEAVKEKAEDHVADYQQNRMMEERQQLMARQRQQGVAQGAQQLVANVGFGRGPAQTAGYGAQR
jgi:hypothetical protein